jgi:hypothetical protein
MTSVITERALSLVMMNEGWLQSTPEIFAYGASVANPGVVSITIPRAEVKIGCENGCAKALAAVNELGDTRLSDTRYMVSRLSRAGPRSCITVAARVIRSQPPRGSRPAPMCCCGASIRIPPCCWCGRARWEVIE